MVMVPDLINGTFEIGGAVALLLNVYRLYKDKKLSGVHLAPTMFFVVWGYWNLFYYPHLHQWISFFGGMGIVIVNTIWVVMAIYYKTKTKRNYGTR